ncbi:unnamed protein product [Arabidopsis halleri]
MCVGFVVDPYRTTKRFKIVCILEMETKYRFEISDGDSWRLSKTTLTTSSKSGLKTRMKPVYVDGNLHWLRNDWSLIAFNPETEQARLIPSSFHPTPDTKVLFAAKDKINPLTLISGTIKEISIYTLLGNHKWALERQIKNVSMEKTWLKCWYVVAYDGKCLVVLENNMVLHVYDLEADSWGVLGTTECWSEDFYKFTPSYFSIEEDEQTKVIVASDDQHISYLTTIMEVIDTTRVISGASWSRNGQILSGRCKANNGMWFGITKRGPVDFLVNTSLLLDRVKANGGSELYPVHFLEGNMSPDQFANELRLHEKQSNERHVYSLIVADMTSSSMVHILKPLDTKSDVIIETVPFGVHTLSSYEGLDSTESSRDSRLRGLFSQMIVDLGNNEKPQMEGIAGRFMYDATGGRDAVFLQTRDEHPSGNLGSQRFGTTSTTALVVKRTMLFERYMEENGAWTKHHFAFNIQ